MGFSRGGSSPLIGTKQGEQQGYMNESISHQLLDSELRREALRNSVIQEIINLSKQLINTHKLQPDDDGWYVLEVELIGFSAEEKFAQACNQATLPHLQIPGIAIERQVFDDEDDDTPDYLEPLSYKHLTEKVTVRWNPALIQ